MIARRPEWSTGTRYANVLPIPVPASIATCAPRSTASATISAILACASRYVKPGNRRARSPVGANRCASSSIVGLYPESPAARRGKSAFPAPNHAAGAAAPTRRRAGLGQQRRAGHRKIEHFPLIFCARRGAPGRKRGGGALYLRDSSPHPISYTNSNDDKTEIARRLDRRGGGAYTTGKNPVVRRVRRGVPRSRRPDARRWHADRAESEHLSELLPAPLGSPGRRPGRAPDVRLHERAGRRRAEQQ